MLISLSLLLKQFSFKVTITYYDILKMESQQRLRSRSDFVNVIGELWYPGPWDNIPQCFYNVRHRIGMKLKYAKDLGGSLLKEIRVQQR